MDNSIRIIAGKWRRRRLPVITQAGLRPSTDRTRETLFSWLAPWLDGANCLDLFAGTGALAFEALSRGAANVTMVDSSAAVVKSLHEVAKILDAESVTEIVRADAQVWLTTSDTRFDIVFVDPPFAQGSTGSVLQRLLQHSRVGPDAVVYVEGSVSDPQTEPGADWRVIRERRTRRLRYYLATPNLNNNKA